jgi:hypothetical protein
MAVLADRRKRAVYNIKFPPVQHRGACFSPSASLRLRLIPAVSVFVNSRSNDTSPAVPERVDHALTISRGKVRRRHSSSSSSGSIGRGRT